jgi:excisionase family DNA binding protein
MQNTDVHGNPTALADYRLLLRPGEVAEMLGVSRSTVYALITAGHLPVVRLGSRRVARVPLYALHAWIEEQTEGGNFQGGLSFVPERR